MEETHTWEKHFRYLSDYFAHSLNVTSERRPRAHAHRPNLLKFTQLCVFASSYGWAAVRAAHITLRSHESADAARGSSHLCDSKKRLSRRIRRSGSGTFHLFSHPLSPTPSAPQAHALALIVACGKNSACLPKTRPWHQQASCWILITAIMYLTNCFKFSGFHNESYMHRHAQHLLKCQNDCIPLKRSPKQGRLVLSSCRMLMGQCRIPEIVMGEERI